MSATAYETSAGEHVQDGAVIGGGDIDPALYASRDDGTGSHDRERDRLEIEALVAVAGPGDAGA